MISSALNKPGFNINVTGLSREHAQVEPPKLNREKPIFAGTDEFVPSELSGHSSFQGGRLLDKKLRELGRAQRNGNFSEMKFGSPPSGGPGPRGLEPGVEEQTFSDALGLMSRLGGKWQQKALEIQALDNGGVVNIDDKKVKSLNWAERLAGTPNGAVAMTDGGKISLHTDLFERSFPDNKSKAGRTERLGRAFLLASVLVHEFEHYKTGKNEETGMYEVEREFANEYQAFEADGVKSGSPKRWKEILFWAKAREDEGRGAGSIRGESWF